MISRSSWRRWQLTSNQCHPYSTDGVTSSMLYLKTTYNVYIALHLQTYQLPLTLYKWTDGLPILASKETRLLKNRKSFAKSVACSRPFLDVDYSAATITTTLLTETLGWCIFGHGAGQLKVVQPDMPTPQQRSRQDITVITASQIWKQLKLVTAWYKQVSKVIWQDDVSQSCYITLMVANALVCCIWGAGTVAHCE